MKKFIKFVLGLFFIGLVIFFGGNLYQVKPIKPVTISPADFGRQVARESKKDIVTEIYQIQTQIETLENTGAVVGNEGYKVYPAATTQRLIALYQALSLRLHYLNTGNLQWNPNQWDEFRLQKEASLPYDSPQVIQAIAELEKNGVPQSFIHHLSIYLLPYVIPDVSGLGGRGYILLSAEPNNADLINNQLTVTLYHEIGHHVHFTYMPQETASGKALWAKFLEIRGGAWHDDGQVNTNAWSQSSEETFAEDFRMLFGSDQPFFGDISLGDPRLNHQQANREIQFIDHLAQQKVQVKFESPWIPKDGLVFWQGQSIVLGSSWVLLAIGMITVNGTKRCISKTVNVSV